MASPGRSWRFDLNPGPAEAPKTLARPLGFNPGTLIEVSSDSCANCWPCSNNHRHDREPSPRHHPINGHLAIVVRKLSPVGHPSVTAGRMCCEKGVELSTHNLEILIQSRKRLPRARPHYNTAVDLYIGRYISHPGTDARYNCTACSGVHPVHQAQQCLRLELRRLAIKMPAAAVGPKQVFSLWFPTSHDAIGGAHR